MGKGDLHVEVEEDATVIDVKNKIAEQDDDYFVDKIRLIFMGRLLKNEKTLEGEKINDGKSLHAVISKPSPPPPAPVPPPPSPTLEEEEADTEDIENEPFDPWADPIANLATIPTTPLTENDRTNRILANPGIGNVLNSLMGNPENMERIGRINERINSGELTHETMNEDEDYMNLLREPNFMENMMQLLQNDPEMMQSITSMMGDDAGSGRPPVEMPNLQSLMGGAPHMNFPSMENLPDDIPTGDLGQIPELPVDTFPENTDFKELYREQLAQLAEFGFTDEERNIEVLKSVQGNVQFAMNRLLD